MTFQFGSTAKERDAPPRPENKSQSMANSDAPFISGDVCLLITIIIIITLLHYYYYYYWRERFEKSLLASYFTI